MSHGITNPAEALYAHKPAWHRLGHVVRPEDADGVTSEEIRRAAPGLFTERRLLPVYGSLTGGLDLGDQFSLISPDGLMDGGSLRLIARTDGANARVHGIASETYRIWQVGEAVDWMDSLVSEGRLRYESAFAMFGGDRVVFVARMPTSFKLGKRDETLAYLLTVIPFTGSASVQIIPTQVRVICQNTERLAKRQAKGKRAPNGARLAFNIRHSANLDTRLIQARKHLAQFEEAFAAEAAEAEALASHAVTSNEVERFLAEMFPEVDADGNKLEGSAATRREIRVRIVRESWNTERETFERIGERSLLGSAWHLLQACTRAADHGSKIAHPKSGERVHRYLEGRKGNARARMERGFLSAVDGSLASLKAKARGRLLTLAGV